MNPLSLKERTSRLICSIGPMMSFLSAKACAGSLVGALDLQTHGISMIWIKRLQFPPEVSSLARLTELQPDGGRKEARSMTYRGATVLILKRFAPKGRFGLLRQFCDFFAEAWRPRNPPPRCDSFNSQNSALVLDNKNCRRGGFAPLQTLARSSPCSSVGVRVATYPHDCTNPT